MFKKLTKDVKKYIQKNLDAGKPTNIKLAISTLTMTSGLKYSLATGNWGDRKNSTKAGVSQVLNRLTFASALSHLRRCNAPLAKEGKMAKPRCRVLLFSAIYLLCSFFSLVGCAVA